MCTDASVRDESAISHGRARSVPAKKKKKKEKHDIQELPSIVLHNFEVFHKSDENTLLHTVLCLS